MVSASSLVVAYMYLALGIVSEAHGFRSILMPPKQLLPSKLATTTQAPSPVPEATP
jgi:hypothetical protein